VTRKPNPFRKLLKRVLAPILKPIDSWYSSDSRTWKYKGVRAVVLPGVFHPGLFLSTKILARYLNKQAISSQRTLELGCGSGWLSAFMANQGAIATASDINPNAVENARANAVLNNLDIEAVQSDLFVGLANRQFDWIIINPPYYPKQPRNPEEHAWFCGAEFEYFQRLFAELPKHIATNGQALMILSEDCALEKIEAIANAHSMHMELAHCERRLLEWNYIFRLT